MDRRPKGNRHEHREPDRGLWPARRGHRRGDRGGNGCHGGRRHGAPRASGQGLADPGRRVGVVPGDQAWFFLGRRWRDLPRLRALAASRGFAKARRVFDRQPGLFVFGFRFAYGLRTVSPIAIGMTDYPAGRFMAINALASLIWAWLFVSLGGMLGQAFTALLGPLEAHEHLLAVLAAAAAGAVALHLLVRRLAKR
ncbi:DedA family protein [Paracoccus aerius]